MNTKPKIRTERFTFRLTKEDRKILLRLSKKLKLSPAAVVSEALKKLNT